MGNDRFPVTRLSAIVAASSANQEEHSLEDQVEHYFEIILPGSILGIVVGFSTQRYGRPAVQVNRAKPVLA